MSTARRSDQQNKRYWALVNRLPEVKDNPENRKSITIHVTGHISTRDLSVAEMNGLCQYLEYLLGEKPLADVEFPNRISHGQASEISRVVHELGWHSNPNRLEGFLLRQTGGRTKVLNDLTRAEAQKVLNGLKFIAKREREKRPASEAHQIAPGRTTLHQDAPRGTVMPRNGDGLVDVRCANCKRLLLRASPGSRVEAKCRCGLVNRRTVSNSPLDLPLLRG